MKVAFVFLALVVAARFGFLGTRGFYPPSFPSFHSWRA
jgi:hypothetical protein